MSKSTKSRLTWREGNYSGNYGFAGKIQVVTVSYRTHRTGPAYVLSSSIIPSIPTDLRGAETLEEAKALAEILVIRWFNTMGAQWKPEAGE